MADETQATKLLLIDDEEGIRKVFSISLGREGYQVFTAASGAEGLNLFHREKPQIVITDLKMPGLDGIDVLRRIKEQSPATEVIILTGHGDMDSAIQALQLDASDFITKPVRNEALGLALRRADERISRRRLKAYASDLAMSLLVLTERFGRLMGAIRSLGFPPALGSAMVVAGSFLGVLGAEAARMKRARESRTPGRLRVSKVGTVGRAAALILLRGWDRSKRVQAAMESRGFTGSLPDLDPYRLRARDVLAAAALLAPFVAVRVILP